MSIIGHTSTTTAGMCFGFEGAQMTVEGEAGSRLAVGLRLTTSKTKKLCGSLLS